MQVILFALFCTMTFVRTYSVEDAVRGSRIQVAESDELSSENENNETFQRFIGDSLENPNAVDDYLESTNRKKRSRQNAEKSSENSELKSRHASECEDDNLGKKHNHLKRNHQSNAEDLRRSRRFLNDTHQNQKSLRAKKRESKNKKKKRRKKKMPESTSPENVDQNPTGETLETTTPVPLNDSTTCVVLTDSTTEEEVVTEISKVTTTTEKILETSTTETTEISTTTAISATSTEENVENVETKELTMKLICKVGKSMKNLRKVFQCRFGNSGSASFLIPEKKKSIDTYASEDKPENLRGNGNSFNMIHEMLKETTVIPEGNRTSWRMIEATGVRARVIEKTPAAGESHQGKNRKRKKKHAQRKSKNLKLKT